MNVLVTGANGQLGRCIRDRVDALNEHNNIYFYTDVIGKESDGIEYLNLCEEGEVKKFVREKNINIIINCAAYTNVDKAETDEENATAVNSTAVKFLAEAARDVGAKLIHISTDYVFNGQGFIPYTEDRMTLPVSVYGKTKLMAEKYIEESGCKYLIFRTAWLYSEYGNNFVKTMLRLFDEKEEINVVNDQIGTPTYAGNLAELIVKICECMTPLEGKETIPLLENGIYHFTDEGVASWYDFAQVIQQNYLSHWRGKCLINGVTTKEYGSKIKRPYYSVLDKTKYKTDFKGLYQPKHWMKAVNQVVNRIVIKHT